MALPTITNLLADAQAKISQRRLIQLTNPDSTASTVNTTILQKACEDSAIYFQLKSATDYDDTNVVHLQVALLGVEAFLKQYEKGASSEVRNIFSRYDDQLKMVNDARSFRLSTMTKQEIDGDGFTSSYFANIKPN
jgi:hypothetical protein